MCYSIKKDKENHEGRNKNKKPEIKGTTYIVKLRIDSKTVITVRTKESLKNWKARYPDAVELS